MSTPNWKNSILITGAGSGFGAALAHRYAADGWNVAVTDIDEDRARQICAELQGFPGDIFSLKLDITSDKQWHTAHDTVLQRWGGLQVLVNNAGVAASGNVEDTSMEDWQWVLDIDLLGVVRGCHRFAALMKQQRSGHIVNISSFAALAGLPFIAAYGVAKAGVVALSEALRAEMHPFGVGVTVACPAFVKTGLLESFRSPHADKHSDTLDKVGTWMETSGISADQVAEEIAKAVRDNKFMLLTHGQTRWAWRMKRWLPQRYFKMLVKRSPGKR